MSTDAHGNRPGKLARDLQFDGALRPHRYSTGLNPESARVETREWRFVNSYADSGENAYLTGSYQRQAPFSAFVLRQDGDLHEGRPRQQRHQAHPQEVRETSPAWQPLPGTYTQPGGSATGHAKRKA